MENTLKDLTCFEDYRNRQVILNYYQEEDFLWKRDGFQFISVKAEPTKFIFQLKQGNVTIPVEEYPIVTRNSDFQNYYIFSEPKLGARLEMYFP